MIMEKISKLHFLSIIIITLLFITVIFAGCNQNRKQLKLSSSIPEVDKTKEVKMLTAFFGLDNALPRRSRLLYEKAPGKDGIP